MVYRAPKKRDGSETPDDRLDRLLGENGDSEVPMSALRRGRTGRDPLGMLNRPSEYTPQYRVVATGPFAKYHQKLIDEYGLDEVLERQRKARRTMALSALMIAAGALWCGVTGTPDNQSSIESRYPLPDAIRVVESSMPIKDVPFNAILNATDGGAMGDVSGVARHAIATKEIDFSGSFDIQTDRYHIIKSEDWAPIKWIGLLFSMPERIFFWDHNVGWGVDADRSRAALAMLEKNTDLKDVTVRLNYNAPFNDLYRLFNDEKVVERNSLLSRATLGVASVLGGSLWAGLTRGSYYNPMTQTVVIYSNIESVEAHELGHHKDFQRYNSDWLYQLSRPLPPYMLLQEWRASMNAKNSIMSPDDGWQFDRYLLPAFFTYIVAAGVATKKMYEKYKEMKSARRR